MNDPRFHSDGRCLCGHRPTPHGCSTGYGYNHQGFTRCNECSGRHEAVLAALAHDRGETFGAYLVQTGTQKDGQSWNHLKATNWTGHAKIARCVGKSPDSQRPNRYGFKVATYRLQDALGRKWFGRCDGAGSFIALRPILSSRVRV